MQPAPSQIVAPGTYYLDADRHGSIEIAASRVTLDLQGRTLRGDCNPGVTTVGINLTADVSEVTIRGGRIQGHHYGVRADRSNRVTIDRVTFVRQTFRGIRIDGDEATITDCRIEEIGGTKLYSDAYGMGIEINGANARVENNVIRDVYPVDSGEGVGILLGYPCDGSIVRRNVLVNSKSPASGRTFGIWSSAMNVRIEENIVSLFSYGVESHGAVGNLLVDIGCKSYFRLPSNDHRARTGRPIICPDDYGEAAHRANPQDRNHLFRLAQIHVYSGVPLLAYAYFRMAARAGSTEAADEADRLRNNGVVDEAEAAQAETLAPALWQHHVRRYSANVD